MAEWPGLMTVDGDYQVTQAIYVAVTLGVPDLLADEFGGRDQSRSRGWGDG